MYNDIIDTKDQNCGICWWATTQGHNPVTEVGKIYCSLNKRDYRKEFSCGSWRHITKRNTPEEPKNKINLGI